MQRRQVLGGLIAAPALLTLRSRALAQAEIDVAIIGAGAAGLTAAHAAREAGLTARIFEARDRLGGRVFTDTSLGTPFDAGAFYVHFAERNPWREIAATLQAELLDDSVTWGDFAVFQGGVRLPPAERQRRRGAFGALMRLVESEAQAGDASFADAVAAAPDLLEAARGLTLLSLGEDPQRVSLQDYQQLESGDDLVAPGGYGALLERYGAGLPIERGMRVRGIDFSGAGVRLDLASGNVRARFALVTVPVAVIKAGDIRFTPQLPDGHSRALEGLGTGALTKLALKFPQTRLGQSPWTQFFDQNGGGDLINFEFWPFGRDLVIASFGGDFARGLAKAGEAAAIDVISGRLAAILGEEVRRGLAGGRLAGWSEDPFARGAYSIAMPGAAGARAAWAEPAADKLFFAGEAGAGGFSMTAGGAAIAARQAMARIAMLARP